MNKKKKGKPFVKKVVEKGPLEWIYELEAEKSMRDIYDQILAQTELEVEFWEEAGVLEVSLSEVGSIDMEQSEEEDVLWVTLSSKGYENAVNAMKEIEKLCGGHFSVDA